VLCEYDISSWRSVTKLVDEWSWSGLPMRRAYVLAVIGLLALYGCQPTPRRVEGPKTLPDVAAAAVVIKHQISQNSDIKPEERWKFVAFTVSEPLQALGFTPIQIERFAKDIISEGPYPSLKAEIEAVRAHYANVSDPNQIN
jgi:hypothetical protein